MSNRTDFETLAGELASQFRLSADARTRVHTELHNAFVAGQERAEAVVWAARRVRDGYPVDERGSYWSDLCGALDRYDANKAESKTIRSDSGSGLVVHALHHGRPLCRFSDAVFPSEWPLGHSWLARGEAGVNCVSCLAIK